MSNVDPNQIAATVITDLTKEFLTKVGGGIGRVIGNSVAYINSDFETYIANTYRKCSLVRTIVNKERSYNIKELYVPGNFVSSEDLYTDQEIIYEARECKPIVIVGFGGIGKTVFSKYVWLNIFEEPGGKIPVFMELRQLNNLSKVDIISYMRHIMSNGNGSIDEGKFLKFIKEGRFIFIFDGFDELPDEKKTVVEAQILELSSTMPRCGYVVSSRHDERFSGWANFRVFRAQPFSEQQVYELIEKIDFDKDVKKRFVSDIIKKRFGEYKSFLATPLLSLMMLMTFHQFAEVPEKRHIFYRYAFLTLYSWHDSSKEAFKREGKTNLVVDQFEKVFSIFCFLTYIEYQFSFDDISFRKYVNKAKKYVEFDFDSEKLISEITESVNLIYRDGDQLIFTHRSFQEYFCAYCIINFFSNRIVDLVPRIRSTSDAVLSMMYEINKDVVEENYIVPTWEIYKSEISEVSRMRSHQRILDAFKTVSIIGCERKERFIDDTVQESVASGLPANSPRVFTNVSGTVHLSPLFDFILNLSWFLSYEFSKVASEIELHPSLAADVIYRELTNIIENEIPKIDQVLSVYTPEEPGFYWREGVFTGLSEIDMVKVRHDWKFLDVDMTSTFEKSRELAKSLKALAVFAERKCLSVSRRIAEKQKNIDDII